MRLAFGFAGNPLFLFVASTHTGDMLAVLERDQQGGIRGHIFHSSQSFEIYSDRARLVGLGSDRMHSSSCQYQRRANVLCLLIPLPFCGNETERALSLMGTG